MPNWCTNKTSFYFVENDDMQNFLDDCLVDDEVVVHNALPMPEILVGTQSNEEYVLIFQPDCLILRDVIKSDFNFDYIGALCGNFNNDSYILNGGLSMRKRDVMIEICENLNSEEKTDQYQKILFLHKKLD